MAKRINKDGTRNKQDTNIQDLPRLNLTPQQRALWKFQQVVALLSTEGEYYDLLPPQAQDIVTAAKIVAGKLK